MLRKVAIKPRASRHLSASVEISSKSRRNLVEISSDGAAVEDTGPRPTARPVLVGSPADGLAFGAEEVSLIAPGSRIRVVPAIEYDGGSANYRCLFKRYLMISLRVSGGQESSLIITNCGCRSAVLSAAGHRPICCRPGVSTNDNDVDLLVTMGTLIRPTADISTSI